MAEMQIVNIDGDLIPPYVKVGIIVPIDKGQFFVIPTDTLWGLGVSPNFPRAIKKLFELKQRPMEYPLPLFVKNIDKAIGLLGRKPTIKFRKLAEAFWPGPLTIIDQSDLVFAEGLYSHGNKIGLRIPKHPIALDILDACREGYLAITSVNRHKEPVLNDIESIQKEFGSDIALLVNSSHPMSNEASTVVDISGDNLRILRASTISEEEIMKVLGM